MLLTLPSVVVFYLRQVCLPLWIGPSYPLRAVEAATLGFSNFVLPVIVLGAVVWLVWRRLESALSWVGLALFTLPLLPALNINAFLPEQLVHDRYLYLPLLGLLMLAVPALASVCKRTLAGDAQRAGWTCAALVVLAVVPLGLQTVRYNQAWLSELALWEWGVRSDPTSAFNHSQHGVALRGAGRNAEALQAFDRALDIEPVTDAFLNRAGIALDEGRFAKADRDLGRVLDAFPDNENAIQLLALSYQKQQRSAELVALLRSARERIAFQRGSLTTNLAVALYASGQKDEALAELEAARSSAPRDPTSIGRASLFYLGALYAERGRLAEAQGVFEEYLEASNGFRDPETLKKREQAKSRLEAIRRKLASG